MDSIKNAGLKKYFIYGLLALIALAAAVLSTQPKFRQIVSADRIQTRQILAKIFSEYANKNYVILKIKTESGIDLEIFEKDSSNNQRLKQKFSLTDDSEAFLMINNNSVNLGLNDVDHDGAPEIIAPTVDPNGNSRLNIYKYKTELDQFVPVQIQE